NQTSTGNRLDVTGGNLFATNAVGNGVLDIRRGTLTLNTGTITTDQLLLNTGNSSVLMFNGGVINTRNTGVTNNAQFVVGDGVNAAEFHLVGGVHSFKKGLRIRNHAVLSGCGTIIGAVVVDPGGSVVTDCGGGSGLTFANGVENNGVMSA